LPPATSVPLEVLPDVAELAGPGVTLARSRLLCVGFSLTLPLEVFPVEALELEVIELPDFPVPLVADWLF
jgi:hypothetical protein